MSPSPYSWFIAGIGTWALAAGMQQVLLSWLLVGELHEAPQWVGAAQMCQSLPALLFALAGGVAADRYDRRPLLMLLHAAAAATACTLAAVVWTGRLGLTMLLAYALCWGTILAFAQPARDALVSEVGGADLMRAVTGVTLTQFIGHAVGARLAGVGAALGTVGAFGLQAVLLVLGLAAVSQLPATHHPGARPHSGFVLATMWEGLREVRRSPALLPIALLVAGDGLFFMGPAAVLCPVIVRDVYQGDIGTLSVAMMTLPLGTIAGSWMLLLRRGVRRKGPAFLLALCGVSSSLVALSLRPPFWGFVAILFTWGVFHSLFFNTSRTLFQEAAPASHRARVLSVHSLGFFGMAPFSHLGAGLLAGVVGPLVACALAGGAMLAVTGLAWVFTGVRTVR